MSARLPLLSIALLNQHVYNQWSTLQASSFIPCRFSLPAGHCVGSFPIAHVSALLARGPVNRIAVPADSSNDTRNTSLGALAGSDVHLWGMSDRGLSGWK